MHEELSFTLIKTGKQPVCGGQRQVPRREVVEQRKALLILPARCLNNLSRLRKPIKELKSHGNPQIAKLIENSAQGAIKGALKALASIEAKIDELLRNDVQLNSLYQLVDLSGWSGDGNSGADYR